MISVEGAGRAGVHQGGGLRLRQGDNSPLAQDEAPGMHAILENTHRHARGRGSRFSGMILRSHLLSWG